MAGLEIMGLILGVYPILATLARSCRGAETSSLERDVQVMEVVYDQTCRCLLESVLSSQQVQNLLPKDNIPINQSLWKDPSLKKKLLDQLGPKKHGLVIDILTQIKKLLDEVASELESISDGPVLENGFDRIKSNVKKAFVKLPRSNRIKERIRQIKDLNRDLERLLKNTASATPWHQYTIDTTTSETGNLRVSLESIHGAREFFDAVRDIYTCACRMGHTVGLGCYCACCAKPLTNDHDSHSWEFALACVKLEASESIDESATATQTVLLESCQAIHNDYDAQVFPDLCALIQSTDTGPAAVAAQDDLVNLPSRGDLTRIYRMKVTGVGPVPGLPGRQPISFFADLVQLENGLSPKDRSELALKLSVIIAQLCQTPWVDEPWTWTDVCVQNQTPLPTDAFSVFTTTPSVKFPIIYILREFYSSAATTGTKTINESPVTSQQRLRQLVDREPVLTKLGLALIELIVGESINDIKAKYPEMQEVDDDHLANYFTAKILVEKQTIRGRATIMYENVVKACIERLYRDREGRMQILPRSGDGSFVSCFEEAVVKPLERVYSSFECQA
ncbi:hypothetical protein QBC43DRAFT_16486 [Cladorrhinum sp. PSN259]|nr:hypothetical protein QBC43DRAFT_16486 [Cladorrhinum sp. PSN259]